MLQLIRLTKVYRLSFLKTRKILAVDKVNLIINRGEIFGLLGPNGAGKTTTVKMIAGLVKPTSGSILLNGHSMGRERTYCLRIIGAVLEGSRNVYWNLTPMENLLYFARLRQAYNRETKSHAITLLKQFELYGKRNDSVGTLSRGMQQKLSLCCALITNPKILLVDEPTLGLDVASKRKIEEMLVVLSREQGKTVLLTSHDMHLVSEVCNRVGIIHNGRLLKVGAVAELKEATATPAYEIRCIGYLNESVRKELLLCTPSITFRVDEDGFSIIVNQDAHLYHILSALEKQGIVLQGIRKKEPSLEEVFLKLTKEGNS
jgi:ABC-2 type transport system ATP-binding protein